MVYTARKTGASAKFAGSGGAIIGTYEDDNMFKRLCVELERIGCVVLKTRIANPERL
jgi:glucuronokinase